MYTIFAYICYASRWTDCQTQEVHGLNNTTWASLAQTAGDLLAALWMQLTPRFFPVQDETVVDETCHWRS